ncbi:hypothetical protein OAO01_00165 [Oligoflexia bacterium]|nr:hypothetical protein [Oligoflexia bacterium]
MKNSGIIVYSRREKVFPDFLARASILLKAMHRGDTVEKTLIEFLQHIDDYIYLPFQGERSNATQAFFVNAAAWENSITRQRIYTLVELLHDQTQCRSYYAAY